MERKISNRKVGNMKKINSNEVVEMIRKNSKNKIFSMIFERVNPKCEKCGYASKKLIGIDECPRCNGKVLKYAFATARLGVVEPKYALKPGTGKFKGESFEEALQQGRLKYFDMTKDDGKGDYRSCLISNIKNIKINGERYMVSSQK